MALRIGQIGCDGHYHMVLDGIANVLASVAAYERDLIQDALKTTRGNRAKAARLLDTTERILNYKVRGYQIDARRFKSGEGVKRDSRPSGA